MRAAFRALRDHAVARGIPFKLPFNEFEKFAIRSDYLNKKGNEGHCVTVDRIEVRKGYVTGNIQPLTREQNSIKKAKVDAHRMQAGMSWREQYEDND